MLACHLQLDGCHTHLEESYPRLTKMLLSVTPITHGSDLLGVFGIQEPISNCLEDLLPYAFSSFAVDFSPSIQNTPVQ